MLTQIRLHGEDPELVQSVINLSIRYGIITPYTSYLIEEDDIFSQAGRRTITEEVAEEMAAPAEVSGEAAVDMAVAEAELAVAEAPQAIEVTRIVEEGEGAKAVVEDAVQFVGSKTFV